MKAAQSVKNSNEVKFSFEGNSTSIFHPNSNVCASIDLILKKAVQSVDSFRIEVRGTEITSFHDFSHLKDIEFGATRNLFEIKGYLLGGTNKSQPVDMDVGTYNYRYLFQVPREAPSSFDGVNGRVRYTITTILDSLLAPDFIKVKTFWVSRFEDFNNYVNLREPIATERMRTYGFGLTKKHLKVKLSSEREGYGKNDKIHVKIEINNTTHLKFPTSFLTFNRTEKSQGETPFHKINRVIKVLGRVKCDAIMPKSNRVLNEELHVPLQSPSTNDHLCEIFQIAYSVMFVAMPEITAKEKRKLKQLGQDMKTAIEVTLPLYIGSVGFHDSQIKPLDDEKEAETFDEQSSVVEKEIREYSRTQVVLLNFVITF